MFDKPLEKLEVEDIRKLKQNRVTESKILDYKKERIEDEKLIKHICGFANSQGGFIVFGIEESDDKPAVPESLPGLTKEDFNIEQIEQIINGNIEPQLKVEMSPPIYKDDNEEKFFIVIRIPEGPDKPYLSTKDDRFYFRHNYQTRRMSEIEISSMYRQRFSSPQRVQKYIENTMKYHSELALPLRTKERPSIFGHIFVFPPNIERRRINTIDDSVLVDNPEEVNKIRVRYNWLPRNRNYNMFGIEWNDGRIPQEDRLEIHRNGLIHHATNYGYGHGDNKKGISLGLLFENALLTLDYADYVYKQIIHFGPLIILFHIENTEEAYCISNNPFANFQTKSGKIEVEREINSWELEEKFICVIKNMMKEVMNHFGESNYDSVLQKGTYEYLLEIGD